MADVLRAMSIAGGVLLTIVGLIVVVSFAAVKRGEAAMAGAVTDRRVWWNTGRSPVAAESGSAATVSARPGAAADATVLELLLIGTGVFVLAILGLLGVSILAHL